MKSDDNSKGGIAFSSVSGNPYSILPYDPSFIEDQEKELGALFFEDLAQAIIHQFIRCHNFEEAKQSWQLEGKPVMYLANHQTGIESFVFCSLNRWLLGHPIKGLAKDEHRVSYLGILDELLNLVYQERNPISTIYFDRSSPRQFLDILVRLKGDLARNPYSVLIHVEGTRSIKAGEEVKKISGTLLDFCLDNQMPMVPVKFSGGLPRSGNEKKLLFPYGLGRQDVTLGHPLDLEELRGKGNLQRIERVARAINELEPQGEEDDHLTGDRAFAQLVERIETENHLTSLGAVFVAALLDHPGTGDPVREFLEERMKNAFAPIPHERGTVPGLICKLLGS